MYDIIEVNGLDCADTLRRFNSLAPETFPDLTRIHLEYGYWWLAFDGPEAVAFAGLVSMMPFPGVGYLKRCYVLTDHRGNGLQQKFLKIREDKARSLGWHLLASETAIDNVSSARNFRRAGYEQVTPEQPWGNHPSLYWVKRLTA